MSEAPVFRNVLRGYDPGEVDRVVSQLRQALEQTRAESADRTVEASKLTTKVAQLQEQINEYRGRIAALETEKQEMVAPPTFADLGARIGSMLTLAEEEATEIRTKASQAAAALESESHAAAVATRDAADRYAKEVSGKADAEATLRQETSKREADDLLDQADREASARRGEAEAVYEHQRARAAAAAADFEKTLAERRDKAAADFAAQMAQHEASIAAAEEKLAATHAEAERVIGDAQNQAAAHLQQHKELATQTVEQARATADRIRRESERELQAVSARRDSITAQLANVRQMLATLGGGALATVLNEQPTAEAAVQDAAAQDTAAPEAVFEPDSAAQETVVEPDSALEAELEAEIEASNSEDAVEKAQDAADS